MRILHLCHNLFNAFCVCLFWSAVGRSLSFWLWSFRARHTLSALTQREQMKIRLEQATLPREILIKRFDHERCMWPAFKSPGKGLSKPLVLLRVSSYNVITLVVLHLSYEAGPHLNAAVHQRASSRLFSKRRNARVSREQRARSVQRLRPSVPGAAMSRLTLYSLKSGPQRDPMETLK